MSDTDEWTTFELDIEHLDGSATVRLGGVLDAASVPSMRDELWPLLARYEAEMVTVDASGLRAADPEGIALLVGFARAMTPGHPVLRGLASELRAPIEAAGCFELD